MANTKKTPRKNGDVVPQLCCPIPMCKRTFTSDVAWKEHLVDCGRRSMQKRFSCSMCKYATNRNGDFLRHKARMHPEVTKDDKDDKDDKVDDRADDWKDQDPGSAFDMSISSSSEDDVTQDFGKKTTAVAEVTSSSTPKTVDVDATPESSKTQLDPTVRKPTRPLPPITTKQQLLSMGDFSFAAGVKSHQNVELPTLKRQRDIGVQTDPIGKRRFFKRVYTEEVVNGKKIVTTIEEESSDF